MNTENIKSQMRKGILEYCTLLILSKKRAYVSDIIQFKYPILYFGKGRLILFVHKNLNYVNGENVKKESQIAIYIVRRVGLNITAR